MPKDFRNIEYHTNQDGDGVRYYACSTLNTKRKELIFHKNKGAIDDYTKAIEIYPNKAYLYNYRAESKRKSGDNEGADEDDRKAEKLKNIF